MCGARVYGRNFTLYVVGVVICFLFAPQGAFASATLDQFMQAFRQYREDFSRLGDHVDPPAIDVELSKDRIKSMAYNLNVAQLFVDRLGEENEKSTKLFDEGVILAQSLKSEELLVYTKVERGYYYYGVRRISLAMPDIIEAVFMLNKNPALQLPFKVDVYRKIGYFLGTIGDYKQANTYLTKAFLEASDKSCSMRAALKDNLGFYALQAKDTLVAARYFKEAMLLAESASDSLRQAKVWGNMALIAWGRTDHAKAIDYLRRDLDLSIGEGGELNTLYATNLLVKLLMEAGRLAESKVLLSAVRGYAESHRNLIVHRYNLHERLLDIALKEKDEKAEVAQRRLLYAMKDSLDHFDGDNVTQQTRWLAQQRIISERLLQTENRYVVERKKMVGWTWAAVFFFLAIGGVYGYTYLRQKKERRVRTSAAEREILLLDDALSSAKQSIAEISASMEEKESLIEILQKALKEKPEEETPPVSNDNVLITLLKSHLQTAENWHEFKRAFVLEYPDFYKELRTKFPELSESNLRIILLSKLHLSTMEMSKVLGITREAIKKSKQRLSKKIGEERYQLLKEMLHLPVHS